MSKLTHSSFASNAAYRSQSFEGDVKSLPPPAQHQSNNHNNDQQQQQQQQQQQPEPGRAQDPPPSSQRYSNKAVNAISRLAPSFLHTSKLTNLTNGWSEGRNDAGDGNQQFNTDSLPSVHHRPDVYQAGIYEIEKPIAAVDISPDASRVVLAGRDLLRTIAVSPEGGLADDLNVLRRVNAKHREQLAIVDVKWSRYQGDVIATAAGSGRIVLYDLNRPSIDFLTLYEHVRQVHKLAFNPHGDHIFLSASHDGSIRMWDLRDVRDSRRSKHTFQGSNQGVRDVKWSIVDAFEFAAATDSGVVQRWDMRKHRAPTLQLNAHDYTCHSLDYHPTSKYLITAGTDKKIKIWDTTRTERRQNACWQLQAPQSVYNVCWRPGGAAPRFEEGAELKQDQTTQIASSYDTKDHRIHVWDFVRPSIPYRELETADGPTTAILWRSENLLWSAGGSSNVGHFAQTDVQRSMRPLDRLNTNVIAMGPDSRMAFFSDARPLKAASYPDVPGNTLYRVNTGSSAGDRLSSSLSAHEASYGESSNMPSQLKNRRRQAAASRLQARALRSGDALLLGEFSDLPASTSGLSLDETFKSSQTGAYGRFQDTSNSEVLKELAKQYIALPQDLQFSDYAVAGKSLESLFVANSDEASNVSDHGLAHTWKVLAWAVKKELEDWSSLPAETFQKVERYHNGEERSNTDKVRSVQGSQSRTQSQRNRKEVKSPPARSGNSSSLPTPKVRPVQGSSDIPGLPHGTLGQSQHGSRLDDLKPSVGTHDFASSGQKPVRTQTKDMTAANIDDNEGSVDHSGIQDTLTRVEQKSSELVPVFDDLEERLTARRAAASTFRITPRPVLRLGNEVGGHSIQPAIVQPGARDIKVSRPDMHRHDSGESFDILSESVESRSRSLGVGSFQESPRSSGASFEDTREESEGSLPSSTLISGGGLPGVADNVSSLKHSSLSTDTEGLLAQKANSKAPYSTHEKPCSSRSRVDLLLNKADTEENMNLEATYGSTASENEGSLCELQNAADKDLIEKPLPIQFSLLDPKPWHASSFLPALLHHHLDRLASVQLPIYLAVYLNQLYPHIFPTAETQGFLQTLGYKKPAAGSSLSYSRLLVTVLSYHAQLVSLRQFTAAADLRQACKSIYPELAFKASPGAIKSFWCRICEKLSKGREKGRCKRCKNRWGGCSVCGRIRLTRERSSHGPLHDHLSEAQARAIEIRADSSKDALQATRQRKAASRRWFYCQACGHGGHSSCMVDWLRHPESEGSCPVPGCRHACGPGARREEARIELAQRKAEYLQLRRGNGVIRDEKIVRESRAVRAVRPSATEIDMPETNLGDGEIRVGGDTVLSNPTVGGIPMESVGGPSMAAGMSGGMALGRNRWRSGRRTARSSIGAGGDIGTGDNGGAAAAAAAADLANTEALGAEINYLTSQRTLERSATTSTTASDRNNDTGFNDESGSILGRLSFDSHGTSLSEQ